MLKEIYIIGTTHSLQIRHRPQYNNDSDQLYRFCQKILEDIQIFAIGEEMSEDGLKCAGGINTVGREIASERMLVHLMCDPSYTERESLGITKEMSDENFKKRERIWLGKIAMSDKFPLLFICGSAHALRFQQLCKMNGMRAVVLVENLEGTGRLLKQNGEWDDKMLL